MKKSAFKILLREEIKRTLKGNPINEARIDEMAKIEGGLKNAIEKVIADNPEMEGLALKKAIKADAAVKAILDNTGEDLYDNQLNKFISLIKGERELQQRGRKAGSGEAKPKENGAGIGTDLVNSLAEMAKYIVKAKKEGKTVIGSKTNPDGTITIKYKKEEVAEVVEPLDEMAKIAGDLKAAIERVIHDNPDLTGLALKKAIKNDSFVKNYLDENPEVELYDNQLNKFIALTKGERELQPRGRKEGPKVEGAKTMEFSSIDEFLQFLKTAEKKGYEVLASKIDGEDVKVKYVKKAVTAEALNESKEEELVRKLIREELTSIMDEEDDLINYMDQDDDLDDIDQYDTTGIEINEFEDLDEFDTLNETEELDYINKDKDTQLFQILKSKGLPVRMSPSDDESGYKVPTIKKGNVTFQFAYDTNGYMASLLNGNPTNQDVELLNLDDDDQYPLNKFVNMVVSWYKSSLNETEELDEMAKIAGDLKSAIEKVINDNPDLDNLPLKKKIKANPEVTAALNGDTLHDNQLNKFIATTKGERVVGPRGRTAGAEPKPKTEPKEKPAGETRGAKKKTGDKQYSFVQGAKSYTVNKTGVEDENDPLKGIAEPTDLELRKMARSGVEGEKEATLKDQQKRKMVNAFVQRMRDAGILDTANRPIDREAYNQAWEEEKTKIAAKLKELKETEEAPLNESTLKMQFLAGIITEGEYREKKQLLN